MIKTQRIMTRASVILLIAITGCATTRMASQVNQELRDRRFSKVLVHGNFQSLQHRQTAEEKLCSEIARVSSSACVKSSAVFFVGKEYTAQEIDQRLSELGVDGVLVVQPTGGGTSSAYIPQSSYTTGTATVRGNTVTGTTRTQTYGGYDIEKPWADYEAYLWSTNDGEVVWYATAASSGNALADWNDLIKSACGKTIKTLVDDRVLRK
jgi:hypothetical protein